MNELNNSNNVRWKKVLMIAGAFMAFSIGSGFATGQELLQFFASFGAWGIAGAIVTLCIFAYFTSLIYVDSQKFNLSGADDVYTHYCGRYIGKFFSWFAVLYVYCLVIMMLAGSGATIEQYFGLNTYIGRSIMGVLVIGSAILGLSRLIGIISKIGPFIILFLIIVCIGSLISPTDGLAAGSERILNTEMLHGAKHWLIAAVLYFTLSFLMLIPFLAGVPSRVKPNRKELIWSGVSGSVLVLGTAVLVTASFVCNASSIIGKQVPILALASRLSPVFSGAFSIILLLGIYATIAPLLCSVSSQFTKEGTGKHKLITLALGIVAYLGSGILPFDRIVSIVLQIGGWVGLIMVPCVLYTKYIRKNVQPKQIADATEEKTAG